MNVWPFFDGPDTVSVTLSDITAGRLPILFASHERDDEGEIIWQFHNNPGHFDFRHAQLVRLETVLDLDPTIAELGDLPIGWTASRNSVDDAWRREGV